MCHRDLKIALISTLCVLSLCACAAPAADEVQTATVTPVPSITTPPAPSSEPFSFDDPGVEQRSRELLGRETGLLTEEDIEHLGQITRLDFSDGWDGIPVGNLSDLPKYFPKLETLD